MAETDGREGAKEVIGWRSTGGGASIFHRAVIIAFPW